MPRRILLIVCTILTLVATSVATDELSAASAGEPRILNQRATGEQAVWSASKLSSGVQTTPGVVRAAYGPPQPQTWAWCGVITPENRVIRTYKKLGGANVTLFCGGPKYSSEPSWGLRHIVWRHLGDWENKAFGTFQSWREIADISISATLADPDIRGKVKAGKHCYSRVVYLWDYQRQRIIGTMIVRVIWRADGDRRIISAYPSASHCDIR